MLIQDIIKSLQELEKQNRFLEIGSPLYDECKKIFAAKKRDDFDPTNPGKIAIVLEEIGVDKEIVEEIPQATDAEKDMGPISLDSQRLEILLEEYDKHRDIKEAEKIALEVTKNPLLRRIDQKDILAAILRKIELENKEKNKRRPTKTADELSDKKLIVEQQLKESIPQDQGQSISAQQIENLAENIVELSLKRIDETKEVKHERKIPTASEAEVLIETKKEEEVIPEEQVVTREILQKDGSKTKVEVTDLANNIVILESTREEILKVLDDLQIRTPEIRKEAIKITNETTAEEVVEEQIESTARSISREIERVVESGDSGIKLTEKQREIIEKTVQTRVERKILEDPLSELNEHELIVVTKNGKVVLETGPTLVEKIEQTIGQKLDSNQQKTLNVVIGTGEAKATKIIYQNSDEKTGTLVKVKGVFNKVLTNDTAVVDIHRAAKLEKEVFKRMIETGTSVKEARETARFIRELQYPPKEPSTTTTQVVADTTMKENGFNEGSNKEKIEEVRIIKNLIKSPVKVSENVERISKLNNKLKGIKGFDKLNNVVSKLKEGKGVIKSLEFLQSVVRFQDTIGRITGAFSNPLGFILKIPAVQNFAVSIATRFGGQTAGAMATQIANYGFQQGVQNIMGQLMTKGAVQAVTVATDAGAKVVVKGATTALTTAGATAANGAATAAAGTGVGIPIAAIILVAELVITAGTKIFKFIKGKLESILETLGLTANGLKNFIGDNFGKGLGGIMKLGATIIFAVPLALGGALMSAMVLITIVVPLIFGLLLGLAQNQATQVSTMVVPKGIEGLTCVKKTDLTGTGGYLANCNVNAPETNAIYVDKALFVNVAERWKAGGGINAERCFNDVVCRAKKAGVNPDFALWAWLHESGASNYKGFDPIKLKDFGIMPPAAGENNFDQQASYFMTYVNSGGIEHCVGDPLITAKASGKDAYWLAISTWYLNGNCDPDFKKNATDPTAWDYYVEMQTTWSWISTGDMPDTAKITPQNCGGGTNKTKEHEDTTGIIWVCEEETDVQPGQPGVAMPTRDPSVPIPEGCPDGWPLKKPACITQGPFGNYSHSVIEALDFGGSCIGQNIGGYAIVATHDGVARGGGSEASPYGFYVDVTGKCNGKVFTSRYAHMPNIIIAQNKPVKKGDILGYVDNSGTFRSPGNEHLHYEFLWRALKMNDWIPQPVPIGCFGWQSCGSVIINK